jgi:hypothetical protein
VREKVTKKKGHPTDSESSEGYETGSDGEIYVRRKTSTKKGAIKRKCDRPWCRESYRARQR